LSVEITNESGRDVPLEILQDLVRFVLTQLRVHREAEVALIAVDETAMAELHQQWMGEPGPTDVLSFPMDELRPPKPGDDAPTGILGDIVLCPSVAERQATTAGHSVMAELQLLTVHGLLHLLGFDHAEPDEEREMFGLQNRLLEQFRGEGSALASGGATS
jgi:probable rRNA maturation factor